jgi:hypothetical protein
LISRYELDHGDSKASVPQGVKGYGLDEWFDYAVVGWDESMGVPLEPKSLAKLKSLRNPSLKLADRWLPLGSGAPA